MVVDFIGKYENMLSDLTYVCNEFNLPFDGYLPKAKGFFRDHRCHYSEFLNSQQMQIINECNDKVIYLLYADHHISSVLNPESSQQQTHSQEYYNQLGYTLQKQGKLEEALMAYAHSIGIDPRNYWAYYHTLGNLLRENNMYSKAEVAYRQAIKIKSDFSWSHYHLGGVLEKQEKFDEALTSYKNIINLYPS